MGAQALLLDARSVLLELINSNEAQVGAAAVSNPSIPRSSIFLTTKLGHPDKVAERLRESVQLIDPSEGGYVDLFLIHAPWAGTDGRKMQWEELEKLQGEGKAKAIGVSNLCVLGLTSGLRSAAD